MSHGKLVLVAAILALAAFVFSPVFEGFHLGCNTSAGDNLTLSHTGLLWCKHGVTPAEREEATAKQRRRSKAEEEQATEERERPAREAREAREAHEFDEQQRANEAKAKKEQAAEEAALPREALESEGKAP